MTETGPIIAADAPATVVELLRTDRAWVEAEFLAILRASGLDYRVAVDTADRPSEIYRSGGKHRETKPSIHVRRAGQTVFIARVRSPPGA